MSDITQHIESVSQRLKGYGELHPASNGRVIILNPPYKLPDNMDLRGIAGVVLKREQNPKIKEVINSLHLTLIKSYADKQVAIKTKNYFSKEHQGHAPHHRFLCLRLLLQKSPFYPMCFSV